MLRPAAAHNRLQENISSGRAQEGLTVYHEGGQLMPSSDAGQQAELLDRLGLGVKLLATLGKRMAATIRRANAEVDKLTTALALSLRK